MLTHERSFRVRFYECDAYGHVNNTTYLRYMQEAAFGASAAAGFDMARYDAIGRYWLIRESEIEYFLPLHYGETVTVKTWIEDFRRVRSRRAYEMRRPGSPELIARASTDWVYIDSATRKPATISSELIAAFFPGEQPPPAMARPHFPEPPLPPLGAFTLRRHVTWQDIDPAQHVNNAVYLAYAEDAGVQIAAAYNWPMTRMAAEGFGIIARRHHIEYREPALLGDELEIATWVSDVKRATATRHYSVRRVRDGVLLARIATLFVWVNLKTNRPMRVPDHFLSSFTPNIVATSRQRQTTYH